MRWSHFITAASFACALMPTSIAQSKSEPQASTTPPVSAKAAPLTVEVRFPRSGFAQLNVSHATRPSESSPEFELSREANYGQIWIERIDIDSQNRFVVRVRVRQTCGPGIHDYTFSFLRNRWVLSRLYREESLCAPAGVVTDWTKTYDYLSHTSSLIQYKGRHSERPLKKQLPKRTVPLQEFIALDPDHESDA